MKRVLITLLCAVLLASCASSQAKYDAAVVDYRIEQSMRGLNVDDPKAPFVHQKSPNPLLPTPPTPPPTPPPATPGVSGWDVLGAIVAIPLLIPLAVITSYPSYRSTSTHCYSYTYKDQYHVKCY